MKKEKQGGWEIVNFNFLMVFLDCTYMLKHKASANGYLKLIKAENTDFSGIFSHGSVLCFWSLGQKGPNKRELTAQY